MTIDRDRLAAAQTQVLIVAAARDIDALARGCSPDRVIEERLIALNEAAFGRRQVAARVMAEQILIWYRSLPHDAAQALMRDALFQHVAARQLATNGIRPPSTWRRSPLGEALLND